MEPGINPSEERARWRALLEEMNAYIVEHGMLDMKTTCGPAPVYVDGYYLCHVCMHTFRSDEPPRMCPKCGLPTQTVAREEDRGTSEWSQERDCQVMVCKYGRDYTAITPAKALLGSNRLEIELPESLVMKLVRGRPVRGEDE